ncbi:MAG: hypothetical protein AVDCRST_MAG85-1251, partial [uncultured Solirubrobacteraceae bacterium]
GPRPEQRTAPSQRRMDAPEDRAVLGLVGRPDGVAGLLQPDPRPAAARHRRALGPVRRRPRGRRRLRSRAPARPPARTRRSVLRRRGGRDARRRGERPPRGAPLLRGGLPGFRRPPAAARRHRRRRVLARGRGAPARRPARRPRRGDEADPPAGRPPRPDHAQPRGPACRARAVPGLRRGLPPHPARSGVDSRVPDRRRRPRRLRACPRRHDGHGADTDAGGAERRPPAAAASGRGPSAAAAPAHLHRPARL